ENWIDNGDGTGFSKFGKQTYTTLTSTEFMFVCVGGFRNENTLPSGWASRTDEPGAAGFEATYGKAAREAAEAEVPPDIILYYDGWTFADNRESATVNAFGASL